MSSFVLMKVLESAAHRYDRGMRLLSGGRIASVYRSIAERVAGPGRRVLDIGCGTGGVSWACVERGAAVVGIDINAEMLAVARSKSPPRAGAGQVEWVQLGAVEIEDRFAEASFDAAVACLVFSELSPAEQRYVLRSALTRLAPGGDLVIADEVRPATSVQRVLHALKRWPLALATYVLTQTSTRAVTELAQTIREAGFAEVREERLPPGGFAIVAAKRPEPLA
jgi:demethylmenaquinone methyltransferase/2-methoxy-6-polyprenyl-1,4-benzoquinol methylase